MFYRRVVSKDEARKGTLTGQFPGSSLRMLGLKELNAKFDRSDANWEEDTKNDGRIISFMCLSFFSCLRPVLCRSCQS